MQKQAEKHFCWSKLCNIRQRQLILGMIHYCQKSMLDHDCQEPQKAQSSLYYNMGSCKVDGQQMKVDRRYSKAHYFPFPQVYLAIWCQDMASPQRQRIGIASQPFKDPSHLKQKMAKRETHIQTLS